MKTITTVEIRNRGALALTFDDDCELFVGPDPPELFKEGAPQQALEYLGFASLLHGRLDTAKVVSA